MKSIQWPFVGAGILFGIVGVWALCGDPNWWLGLPLQAAALTLLWRGFPDRFPVLAEFPAASSVKRGAKGARRGSKRKAGGAGPALFFTAVVLFFTVALVLLQTQRLAAGVAVAVAALVFLAFNRKRLEMPPAPASKASETPWLWGLLVLAALVRLPLTGQNFAGLQIDEANNLMSCVSVLEGVLKSPFATAWWGNPSFTYFLAAGAFKLFGLNLVVARCVSAVDSVIVLFLFYRLCRLYFGVPASWLASFLFSVSWWDFYFSFSPFHNMFTVLFETGTLYFLLRALRNGKRSEVVLTGLFMAASVMSYLPGRLVPAMIFLTLLALWAWRGKEFPKAYGVPMGLGFLAFLWFVGPFVVYCAQHPGDFLGRTQELSVFKVMQANQDWFFPAKTFFYTFCTFFWPNVQMDPRFSVPGTPVLDAFSGGLALLGLFLSFFTGPARLRAALWVGLVVAFSTNALAVQGSHPLPSYFNPMRCFLVIPFWFLAAAFALEWIFRRAQSLPRTAGRVLRGLLLAGTVFAVAFNARVYFVKFSADQGLWAALGYNHMLAAKAILDNAPLGQVVVHWTYDSSVVQFLTYHRVPLTPIDHPELPFDFQAQRDVVLIFEVGEWSDYLPEMHRLYPGAEWSTLSTPWKQPFLWAAT